MSEEQLEALLEVIEAKVNERIGDAFGRDTLLESMRFSELKQEFIDTFIFGE
jgi:hypothetical protein